MSKYGRFNFGSAYVVNTGPDDVDSELSLLRRELAALKATLADRETALANAALDAQQSRERWQQESQRALQAWRADEAAQFAAAEAQGRQQSADALAEATARCEAAELKLEQLGQAALRARQQDQRALLNAEQAWRADEAARFAAAEAQWRQQSSDALAEAMARCEAAELKLEQLGQSAVRERHDSIAGAASAKRAKPETRFEEFVSETKDEPGSRPQDSRIVLRPDRLWVSDAAEQSRRTSRKHAVLGVLGAASLSFLAIAIYFGVGPVLQSWRSNTAVVAGAPEPIRGGSDTPGANISQAMAVVVRDVNVRASPSRTASVVSTLPRGVKVAMIEQRGAWTLVEIEGGSRNMTPRRGWVSRSFLRDE